MHGSMGSEEMHPRVLRELADLVASSLPMIFEKSWQSGEITGDWKKGNIALIFKKKKKEKKKRKERGTPGTTGQSASPLCLERSRKILLEAMLRHMEDEDSIRDSQHGFARGKFCLTNCCGLI